MKNSVVIFGTIKKVENQPMVHKLRWQARGHNFSLFLFLHFIANTKMIWIFKWLLKTGRVRSFAKGTGDVSDAMLDSSETIRNLKSLRNSNSTHFEMKWVSFIKRIIDLLLCRIVYRSWFWRIRIRLLLKGILHI